MIECPWWLAGTVCFCITSIAVLRFVYNVLYGIQRNLKREFNSKPFVHTPWAVVADKLYCWSSQVQPHLPALSTWQTVKSRTNEAFIYTDHCCCETSKITRRRVWGVLVEYMEKACETRSVRKRTEEPLSFSTPSKLIWI